MLLYKTRLGSKGNRKFKKNKKNKNKKTKKQKTKNKTKQNKGVSLDKREKTKSENME